MIDMYKYKNIISDFFDELDDVCRHHNIKDRQKLSKKDNYLLTLLFSCRNKLADIFNCIGDDNWELPDTYLDITPTTNDTILDVNTLIIGTPGTGKSRCYSDVTQTTDDAIDKLNDELYFTCKSGCVECYQKCEDCEYYSISYKDFQKAINTLKGEK